MAERVRGVGISVIGGGFSDGGKVVFRGLRERVGANLCGGVGIGGAAEVSAGNG